MKRIWNALRFGDRQTRKCIGSVILFVVLAVLLMIASGITGQFYLFIFGMVSGVIALLVSQTFTLVEDDFVAETGSDREKERVEAVKIQKNKEVSQKKVHKNEAQSEHASGKEDSRGIEKTPAKQMEEVFRAEEDISYDNYNELVIKKIKKKYHVKKDHRPILIDNSKSYHIKECPAFIWRTHNKVYILLLEREPRRISISRDLIRHMGYAPGIRAERSKEYQSFQKKNLVTSVFGGFQPDYLDFKLKDSDLKYKNLYTIYPDIQISNRSASEVMDLLCLNFMPEDKITKSEKINGFFKRIYAAQILFKDHVYSITEYKEAVEKALGEMCYAEMPDEEFVITLENLVKARLISRQYAEHYIQVKSKISKRKVQSTYRR